ncbi:MAG TPA: bifunctional hydroxymethylpyrimidine kinase/phosphomethylpyrimidine kinase [Cellvibrionaceae bacterium]
MPSSTPTHLVVTIAGSDCSGGAGIQADLKTFGVFGVFGASVITAVTAQNSQRFYHANVLSVEQFKSQWRAVREGAPIAAIKLGMLGSCVMANAVADALDEFQQQYPAVPIIIDPVLKASTGGDLSGIDACTVYKERLIPLAHLLTPNILEAARLLNVAEATDLNAAEQQAHALKALGANAILLKGGHLNSLVAHEQTLACDLLVDDLGVYRFTTPRLQIEHSHGSGCTLASAIAAGLAQGLALRQAIAAAKTYMAGALAQSARLQLAPVNGPIHHFYAYW